MKKNLILTSLAALVATSAANAATDVTFSGWSEDLNQDIAVLTPDDKGVVHADTSAIKTTYDVKVAQLVGGNIAIDEETGKIVYDTFKVDSATKVNAEGFDHLDKDGNAVSGTQFAYFVYDADNDDLTVAILENPNTDGKFTTAEAIEYKDGDFAWNTVLNKSEYEFGYDTDAGHVDTNLVKGAWSDKTENYNLLTALKAKDAADAAAAEEAGTEYNSFLTNISVSDSVVKITNGTADENKTKFTYAANGHEYRLDATGNALLKEDNEPSTLSAADQKPIVDALKNVAEMADDLLDARAAVSTTDGGTSLTADEQRHKTAYETALAAFEADQTKIDNLKLAKNSRDDAIASYKAAVAGQESAAAKQKAKVATADALAQEAYDLYNAPISETVNGAADRALDAAKAYADAGDARTLAAANAYTDKKVDTLEKDISGGVAAATALSAVNVSGVSKGEVSVGGGYGYYNGESAVAFGAAMGLTDRWSVNAGAGIASGNDTQVSFRAGTNYKFKLF